MNLLQLAEDVADEVGFKRPSYVVGNNDPFAKLILVLVNREGQKTAAERRWSVLSTQATITLVPATQTYTLPSDFDQFLPVTGWNRTSSRILKGPVTPIEWHAAKGIGTVLSIHMTFRLNDNVIEFEDDVTSADTIGYEYISKNWAKDSGGTAKALLTADDDEFRLDDELIRQGVVWRFRKAKGLPFADDFEDYNQYKLLLAGKDGSAEIARMTHATFDPRRANLPEGDFPS